MKKLTTVLVTALFGLGALGGLIGCASKENHEVDYLRCNQTSNGKMAETEDGYFFISNQFMYYADKDNIENWVPVCNKPDCFHNSIDGSCNAYLPSTSLWQKDGKFYGLDYMHDSLKPYIYEKSVDGSIMKNVYEIPTAMNPSGAGHALFQDSFVIRYNYLDEKGYLQEHIVSLENDENGNAKMNTLYEDVVKNASLIISGNEYWRIRGENLIATSLYSKEGDNAFENLCKIEEGKIKQLNLPDDIDLTYGHFETDIFTYYKQNEGFYQYNINTGENELILENQLEDSRGYILSEDCIIECNRYLQYTPEEAHLKFYNGEKWSEVALPEEVAKSNNSFYPLSIASDRIFFRRNVSNGKDSHKTTIYIYYMMLHEESPELIFAGKIGDDVVEEEISTEAETSTEVMEDDIFAKFEEVIVFDTDEYFLKVTDIYLDYKNRCCIDFYFENRSKDKTYDMYANECTINGIQCNTAFGMDKTGKSTLRFFEKMVDSSRLSEFYSSSEYTDIEFSLEVSSWSDGTLTKEKKIVNLYPQGEEKATRFTREHQEGDIVLVNNENASVIITGYDELFVPNDMMNVIIENKTDQCMCVKVAEASANGFAVTPNVELGVYQIVVNPGAVAMYPMTFFDENQNSTIGGYQMEGNNSFLTSNNITSVEEIKMRLQLTTYWELIANGELLFDEVFTLNP